MKCMKCGRKEYLNKLCRGCFMDVIGRKVRKEIRLHNPLRKNETLLVKDSICRYFLEQISMPLRLVKKGKHNREVIPWTMDDEVTEFLDCLFRKKKQKESRKIKLFRLITEEELLAYAKLKKIKVNKLKQNDLKKEFNKLAKRYPQIKHGLLRSSLDMKKINT